MHFVASTVSTSVSFSSETFLIHFLCNLSCRNFDSVTSSNYGDAEYLCVTAGYDNIENVTRHAALSFYTGHTKD